MGTKSIFELKIKHLMANQGKSWSTLVGPFQSTTKNQQNNYVPINGIKFTGLYPEWDEFYLLVCDICGQVLRPQALDNHIETRHRKKRANNETAENHNIQLQNQLFFTRPNNINVHNNVTPVYAAARTNSQSRIEWGGESALDFHPRPAVIRPFDQTMLRNRRLSYQHSAVVQNNGSQERALDNSGTITDKIRLNHSSDGNGHIGNNVTNNEYQHSDSNFRFRSRF